MRAHRPAGQRLLDQRANGVDRRDDDLEGPVPLGQQPHRFAEGLHETAHLRRAAAGQHQQNGLCRIELEPRRHLGLIEAPDPVQLLDQRMADIGAGRSAEALVRGRLERQQPHHVIDIGAHLAGPARPPRPHARRNVVDDRNERRALADALGDGMRELRRVDDHDGVGLGGDGGIDRAVDARHDARQARQDRQRPHHRDVGQRELRGEPRRLHVLAPDPQVVDASLAAGAERAHQLAAQRVAGVLARDQEDAQVVAAGGIAALARRSVGGGTIGEAHARPPSGAAMRNSRWRSAASMPCARSSGERPMTAMPASWADAAAATTEARSAVTSPDTTATAVRRPQRPRPHWRKPPERAMRAAIPSPHSMLSTCPRSMTVPPLARNGRKTSSSDAPRAASASWRGCGGMLPTLTNDAELSGAPAAAMVAPRSMPP